MQILISVLKGDQNYHYENIAFVCNASGQILRLAPMIDHEFSTYFMFPDNIQRHTYWLDELKRSIEGKSVRPEEYKDFPNEKERRLMERVQPACTEISFTSKSIIRKSQPPFWKT